MVGADATHTVLDRLFKAAATAVHRADGWRSHHGVRP
jgi:hypothetical protein